MLEKLQTLFSPSVYPIVMALAVTVLALVLVSIMRRVVTLLLQRSAPHWVDRVTLLLQAAVLVGELAFIISFIAPSWLVVFLVSLLFALVAAALFPGNPISDKVIAVWPLRTLLQTPQGQVRLHNSSVASVPILVHADPQEMLSATVNRGTVESSDSGVAWGTRRTELSKPPIPHSASSIPHSVYIAPLVKRPALGKRSIKSLYR